MTDDERLALRRRDFWAALALIGLSGVFLWRTSRLPFFKASAAGVQAEWYNSAALVPYGIFAILLVMALGLLVVAIRDGGVPGIGAWPRDTGKVAALAAILTVYIFALVPRVDFTIASALTITALILGFHEGRTQPRLLALGAVVLAGLYSAAVHFPREGWNAPHDDDWVALGAFVALAVAGVVEARAHPGDHPRTALSAPVIGLVVPFLLVAAMAFGFRQNVPNRGGLIFSQVEYHYYVTLQPWLSGE